MNIILETSRSHPKNEIKIYVSKRTPTRIHASSEILSILHNAAHFIVFVFDVEFLFIPSCYFLLNYIPIWYFEFLHGIFGEIGDLLATALSPIQLLWSRSRRPAIFYSRNVSPLAPRVKAPLYILFRSLGLPSALELKTQVSPCERSLTDPYLRHSAKRRDFSSYFT